MCSDNVAVSQKNEIVPMPPVVLEEETIELSVGESGSISLSQLASDMTGDVDISIRTILIQPMLGQAEITGEGLHFKAASPGRDSISSWYVIRLFYATMPL